MLYIVFPQPSAINIFLDKDICFHSNSEVAVACGEIIYVMLHREAVKAGECRGWFTLIWEGTFTVVKKC